MTEKYTPEKVAELVAESRVKHCSDCDHFISAMGTALTAVSAERDAAVVKLPDCDGGCDYTSGPEETCSAHGRPVAEVWRIVQDVAAERDEALEVAEGYVRLHKAITEALELTRPGASVPFGVSKVRRINRLMAKTHRILRAALDKEGNDDE